MADHDTPNLNKLRHPLDKNDPDSVNPLNAGGKSLSLPEVKESLAGKMCESDASSTSESPLSRWIIRYQAFLPLLIQMIEQKVEKLPEPSEELQSEARKLRTDQRASASAVLNWLLYKLAVRNEKDEEIIQSELLHGLLIALEVRLDDKPIHSEEEARVDYDQFTITMVSGEVSLEDSSIPPEIEHMLRSQQNSTDISSVPPHKPIGLFVCLNPDPQAPISTEEESTLQYMCSGTKPLVIALTAN